MFKIDFIVWKSSRFTPKPIIYCSLKQTLQYGNLQWYNCNNCTIVGLKQTLQYGNSLTSSTLTPITEFKIDFIVWKFGRYSQVEKYYSCLKQTLQYGNVVIRVDNPEIKKRLKQTLQYGNK